MTSPHEHISHAGRSEYINYIQQLQDDIRRYNRRCEIEILEGDLIAAEGYYELAVKAWTTMKELRREEDDYAGR